MRSRFDSLALAQPSENQALSRDANAANPGEPAQFLITSRCPQEWPNLSDDWPPLPLCVWVFLNPNLHSLLPCGKGLYGVDVSRMAVCEDGTTYAPFPSAARNGYTPVVCECMGHLIE